MKDYGYQATPKEVASIDKIRLTKQVFTSRGIDEATYKAYGSYGLCDANGTPQYQLYPYAKGSKVRNLKQKNFHTEGNMVGGQLYGKQKFSAGSAMSITICEGEDDAMAVYQMLGSKYPAVSVTSANNAKRDCSAEYDYLNSFDKIYLAFDSDAPGQDAVRDVARLFDVNKIYHVKMSKHKDPREYLVKGDQKEFVSLWWNTKKFLPKGILSGVESVKDILNKKSNESVATYPFDTLNSMTYGIRNGELILFTAQEKIGKTEVMRAIEYHLLKTTDENVGIIHLEEQEKRSIQGLVGYELGVPVHLPDSTVNVDQQVTLFNKLTKDKPDRVFFYSHFGSDDPDTILDVIRYMGGACGCKFIFLDHITMVVTGHGDDGDERRKLDYISTKLAEMTRELDFTLFLVSHVNEEGRTRGSRNISKVADLIVSLDRDIEAPTTTERNTTKLVVKGNRFGSASGPAGNLWFNPETFKLEEETEQVLAEKPLVEAPF